VELEHTSGTSEERTPVVLGRGWWQEQETRALILNPFVARVLAEHPSPRRVLLTTPTCNGTACHSRWSPRSARTHETTLAVNQARIPFLLEEAEQARMAEEITEWSPQFLDLDPVHGAWFALYCERNGVRFPSLRFVLCSYEFTSVLHRRILERVFRVPVFDLYGSTETGHLLMEDEHGVLRPSPETAYLEVVDQEPNGIGDLVVTTLTNDYMPLLRYRIGDLVKRQHTSAGTAYELHGRARDTLKARDGRRVTTRQVDRCFAGVRGIAHYELRQLENGNGILRFVREQTGPDERDLQNVARQLGDLLQTPDRIGVEPTDLLGPAPSGKFRLTLRS
jgi:phenylacetate-CoA ligase